MILELILFVVGIVAIYIGKLLGSSKNDGYDTESVWIPYLIGAVLIIVSIVFFVMSIIVIVEPGNVGVVTTLGSLDKGQLNAGLHILNPLSAVTLFSVRTVSDTQTEAVLTSDGLTVTQDLTVLFRVNADNISALYLSTGPNYQENVLDPVIRSVVRDVTSRYSVQGVYNDTTRTSVAEEIKRGISPEFTKRGVIVESVIMRKPQLPSEVETAIKNKITAEQMIQQKDYEVQTAMKNAEIKRQDAYGIADANKIIANSLSPRYLQWEWLQKVTDKDTFYVSTGQEGFPVNLVQDVMSTNSSR
jgi:regulator of protease activity HflC (stomatin/prohibitin superfamily)